MLRTHVGRGADTHVCKGSSEDIGGKKFLHVLRNAEQQEHVYLRLDLAKSVVRKDEIDRAVLTLTVEGDGIETVSKIKILELLRSQPFVGPKPARRT